MITKINDEDIIFCECLYNPICMAEALFTNYDNLALFEEGKLGHVRLAQIPLFSFEYSIRKDPNLNDKENFILLVKTANSYVLGGRNFGKTLSEKIDILISLLLHDGWPMGLTSYDAVHIRGVLEPIIECFETHPIIKEFKNNIKRSPTYLISSKSGAILSGINMNINNKNPGNQFFGHHLKKLWMEEMSFETEDVYKNRVDSRHEDGCIERGSGMCNFTKHSPAGKLFYDLSLKPHVLNLPQYVNPKWDSKEKEKAIKKFGGESSVGYRIFIKGEVVEEGLSVFDMNRIRPFYVENRTLKFQEVTKQKFPYFKNIVIVERPNNASAVYVCADVGEAAPTEIIILAQVNNVFKFLYNITLHGLTDKEQYTIFEYLGRQLNANFIGIDTTDGLGRSIFRRLEEVFLKENLIWCFTDETEVLTDSGWKSISLLTNVDKVLSLNPETNKSFYSPIKNFYKRKYKGNLIEYNGKRLKFKVTPDHNMLVKPYSSSKEHIFIPAKDLKGHESIKRDLGKINNKNHKKTVKIGKYIFNSNLFFRFLGWYLSEGCVHEKYNSISLYQSFEKNKNKYIEICNILKKLGFKYSDNGYSIYFSDKILAKWIRKNCYFGTEIKIKSVYNCYNKKIPDCLRTASNINITSFLESYRMGDGWISCSGQIGYLTTSKKLADDVLELILKIGKNASISFAYPKNKKYHKAYRIYEWKNNNYSTAKLHNLNSVYFDGDVYDIEVEPYHTFYVKYKGKSFWTGNCSFNEKINVDFDKDERGNIFYKHGQPVYVEEYVSEWSVRHLKDLLYSGKIEIPEDSYKLDTQLNSIKVFQSGTRTIYTCVAEENHIFQAFQVFAIAEWYNQFNLITPIPTKEFCKGFV